MKSYILFLASSIETALMPSNKQFVWSSEVSPGKHTAHIVALGYIKRGKSCEFSNSPSLSCNALAVSQVSMSTSRRLIRWAFYPKNYRSEPGHERRNWRLCSVLLRPAVLHKAFIVCGHGDSTPRHQSINSACLATSNSARLLILWNQPISRI